AGTCLQLLLVDAVGHAGGLEPAAHRFTFLTALPQIIIEWSRGDQISADDGVNMGQAQRAIRADDGLRAFATLEGIEHQFEKNAATAHPENARRIFPKRNRHRQRLKVYCTHARSAPESTACVPGIISLQLALRLRKPA